MIIIADAKQIVTSDSAVKPQRGKEMGKLCVEKNASLSLDPKTGKILGIGSWKELKTPKAEIIDAKNQLVLPGFVDSHTHPVYAGSRVNEFQKRAQGRSYLELLAEGGGILSTVKATAQAADSALIDRAKTFFRQMLCHGTTTLEAKSGYGLSLKEELRELKILEKLKTLVPVEIHSTFLGAHAIPENYKTDPDAYVELVCDKMLPAVAEEKLAEFCDVFCEKEAFSINQTRRILKTAAALGLKLKIHADEFESTGGAELAVETKACSADHLRGISEKGIEALANSDTVATLLPATSFFLGNESYAPARKLIDSGSIVALATDFNAGSNQSFSMPMAMSLGLLRMKMTPEEIIVAGTLHGAAALGISNRVGSLHPGKQADVLLVDGEDYRELFYHFGTNPIRSVIKRGKVIHDRPTVS